MLWILGVLKPGSREVGKSLFKSREVEGREVRKWLLSIGSADNLVRILLGLLEDRIVLPP
jgi:hypothetical protein